jgi:hypothetical protein
MCFSKHILFKSDRTDKNMYIGFPWERVAQSSFSSTKVRCSLLAESTDKVDDKLFNKRSASKPIAVVTKALAGSANPIWQTPQLSVRLA